MNHGEFDAIVIGAGPAGCNAASHLAHAGRRVLLCEKQKMPRQKICGGGLSRRALRHLLDPLQPVIHAEIEGAYLAYADEGRFYLPMCDAGVMIERTAFDHYLAQCAGQRGVTVIEGVTVDSVHDRQTHVDIMCGNKTYTGRYVIAADGAHSMLRSRIAPECKPSFGFALEGLLFHDTATLHAWGKRCLFDFGAIPWGYGWIFPKKDHFNVGVYKYRNAVNNRDMKGALSSFIQRNPILQNPLRSEIRGHPIPTREISRLYAGNVLFVGDAAGLGDAFYGEGITAALWSGKIAAETVALALDGRKSVDAYTRKLRPLRRELAFSRILSRLFYSIPRPGFHRMVRNKYLNHLFSNLLTGRVTYVGCFWKTLSLLPYWLFSERYELTPEPDTHSSGNTVP